MLRRLFPNLADWPKEKLLVLPLLVLFALAMLIDGVVELLLATGKINIYQAAAIMGSWWL